MICFQIDENAKHESEERIKPFGVQVHRHPSPNLIPYPNPNPNFLTRPRKKILPPTGSSTLHGPAPPGPRRSGAPPTSDGPKHPEPSRARGSPPRRDAWASLPPRARSTAVRSHPGERTRRRGGPRRRHTFGRRRAEDRGGGRSGCGEQERNALGLGRRARPGVGFDPPKPPRDRRMRSDGRKLIAGARAFLGPGGTPLSRPRPRLRPGARVGAARALAALGRAHLGRFGLDFDLFWAAAQ
jgi:hypothetical protein